MMADIDRLQKLTEILETREATVSMIVDEVGIGTWDFDVSTLSLHWNAHMRALWGYTEDDPFLGTYDEFLSRVVDEDRDRVDSLVNSCILSGDPYRVTYRVMSPCGRVRNIIAVGKCIPTDGPPVRMVGICIEDPSKK